MRTRIFNPGAWRYRCFSNTTAPVELSYTCTAPPDGNERDGAVVILHGLFGSKRNFSSLAKAFMKDLNRPIYALDLRNHGSSLHAAPMTYESMAQDVHHFIKQQGLKDVSVLGHSMGGKVAMALALSNSSPDISNLIIADIAPTQAALSPSFVQYLETMSEIEDPANDITTREQAGKVLEVVEKDLAVRQFLLTNLVLPLPADPSRTTVKFQIPVPLIKDSIAALGSFPFSVGDGRKWDGRTLVVKGAKSKYINDRNVSLFNEFFPKMQIKVLDAGHWVHAEKPNEFKKILVDFIIKK